MELNLSNYRRNVHSQCGEDGVVEKLLDIIGRKSNKVGYLVEFGAWDGIYLSNIHYHCQQYEAFRTIRIECNQERFEKLTGSIRWDEHNILLNILVQKEGENSLNEIFRRYNVSYIPLLSIDVDGEDLNIWKSLNTDIYRPKIVIIEEGGWQDPERLDYLVKCFDDKGYNLVHVTGNFIFVDKKFGIKAKEDVHALMRKSGNPEYDLFYKTINADEYADRIQRSYLEKDVFTEFAGQQLVEINS